MYRFLSLVSDYIDICHNKLLESYFKLTDFFEDWPILGLLILPIQLIYGNVILVITILMCAVLVLVHLLMEILEVFNGNQQNH